MTDGPSLHLTWLRDLSCWNRLDPPRPFHGIGTDQLVAVYPLDLRKTNAVAIAAFFEPIRAACCKVVNEDVPIIIGSAFRPVEYDHAAGGVSGWHPRAGAIDMWTPAKFKARGLTSATLRSVILDLDRAGQIPTLGGLGIYDWGCHGDIRPRVDGKIVQWDYRTAA